MCFVGSTGEIYTCNLQLVTFMINPMVCHLVCCPVCLVQLCVVPRLSHINTYICKFEFVRFHGTLTHVWEVGNCNNHNIPHILQAPREYNLDGFVFVAVLVRVSAEILIWERSAICWFLRYVDPYGFERLWAPQCLAPLGPLLRFSEQGPVSYQKVMVAQNGVAVRASATWKRNIDITDNWLLCVWIVAAGRAKQPQNR